MTLSEMDERMAFAEIPEENSPTASSNYEFTLAENVTIQNLADKMRFVGMFIIIAGALACLTAFVEQWAGLVSGVINIFIGVLTVKAAGSFEKIAHSKGRDIQHLMDALGELLKLYRFQFVMIIVAVVILALVVGYVLLQQMMA